MEGSCFASYFFFVDEFTSCSCGGVSLGSSDGRGGGVGIPEHSSANWREVRGWESRDLGGRRAGGSGHSDETV